MKVRWASSRTVSRVASSGLSVIKRGDLLFGRAEGGAGFPQAEQGVFHNDLLDGRKTRRFLWFLHKKYLKHG